MNKQTVIDTITQQVRQSLEGEGSGHDWWHIQRVLNMAKHLGTEEQADLFIVQLGALLHDIADWKFHEGDDTVGPRVAREILTKLDVEAADIDHVCAIVAGVSYKGAGVKTDMPTLEGRCVQDADRLDAIGAIGIARTFVYTGHKKRLMHDPSVKPVFHDTKEAYFKGGETTINHFYEKLLLLKDRMQTQTGKAIAASRHEYMEQFLKRFYAEWDGQI